MSAGPLLGGIVVIGLLLMADGVRVRRPLSMLQRVGPYVIPGMEVHVDPWLLATLHVQDRARRLRGAVRGRAGRTAIAGGAVGLGVGLLLAAAGAVPLIVIVLGAGGMAAGVWCERAADRHRRRERAAQIDAELPGAADLLAFCVAAGLSPVAALERVAVQTRGPLGTEVQEVRDDVRAGAAALSALQACAARTSHPGWQRLVESVAVALERGTPVADVLRVQAEELRAARRRILLEMAGRRDVLMLVPVVFLILPTVIVIALFPALTALRLLSS